jgi:aryl sulfotransferase
MRKVARFLDIDVPAALWPELVKQASFETMKANAEELLPMIDRIFAGGAQSFIHKGTNGRWKDVLTEAELKECDAAIARTLTPDCARWLEHGGPIG